LKKFKNVILRIFAVFVLGALGTIGAASIFGVNTLTAAAIAGLLAVAEVVQELARYFVADGGLTDDEINKAFSKSVEPHESEE